jgi:alpha-beta hydrolase superfamily lysophospholipase
MPEELRSENGTPESFRVRSSRDELELFGRRWRPARHRTLGNLVIAHGMGEHGARYAPLAERLAEAGLAVWVPDLRGHGASAGPDGLGDFGVGGWSALVSDLADMVSMAAEQRPDLPTLLFGHSMGSLAAQQFATERSRLIDGLILSGTTCFDLLSVDRADADAAAEGGPDVLAALNAPFEPARTPYDWLSRDRDAVDRYLADPLCGTSLQSPFLDQMLEAAAELAAPARLRRIRSDLPVLCVAGDADPLNGQGALLEQLRDRWQAAGVRDIRLQLYPDGRHEMLNELNRDAVIDDLLHWITGVLQR